MKNHFGFRVLMLISLCMIACSGWLNAAQTEDAWQTDEKGRVWAVTKGGGHMDKGDVFAIEELDNEIEFRPKGQLKDRWGSTGESVKLIRQEVSGQPDTLCGFAEVNDPDHGLNEETNSGSTRHGKWHRFEIRVLKKNKLLIIWLPGDHGHGSSPVPKNCGQSETPNHGGMAHANG